MDKLLFSKFSYERAEQFRIRTDILEKEDGTRCVRKYAGNQEAAAHLDTIHRAFLSLQEEYCRNDMVDINHCVQKENYLELEYIEGNTYESLLDSYYDKGQMELLTDEVKRYVKILKSQVNMIPFTPTDLFADVFGKENFPEGMESFPISNIDLIFGNVIVNDKWNIVDYEWTFDFPIPVNYIFFRAIHYYAVSSRRHLLNADVLYEAAGLHVGEIEQYTRMERHFQNYVLGKVVQMYEIHDRLHQGEIRQSDLYTAYMTEKAERKIKVYEDFGEGYSEDTAYYLPDTSNAGCIQLPVKENVSKIRVDIARHSGILRIREITDQDGRELEIANSNGICWEKYLFFYDHDYPNIEIDGKGLRFIQMEYAYDFVEKSLVKSEIELIEKYGWLYREKCEMNEHQLAMADEITQLNKNLEQMRVQAEQMRVQAEQFSNAYQSISNSTIWRVSRPIRKILDKLKGHR